jgi:hypothetical protein
MNLNEPEFQIFSCEHFLSRDFVPSAYVKNNLTQRNLFLKLSIEAITYSNTSPGSKYLRLMQILLRETQDTLQQRQKPFLNFHNPLNLNSVQCGVIETVNTLSLVCIVV